MVESGRSRWAKRIAAGFAGATAAFVIAFLVFPKSIATAAILAPGILLLPVMSAILPEGTAYRLAEEAGMESGVLIAIPTSLVVWGVASGFAWWATSRWRKSAGLLVDGSPK